MKFWHTFGLMLFLFAVAIVSFVMADRICKERGGILVATVLHGAKCIKAEVIEP
jgi:hypothetical protein